MGVFSRRGSDDGDMPFFDHLEALRPRLIRSAAVLVVLMCAAFFCKGWLMAVIMGPQSPDFATNRLFARMAVLLSSEVLHINRQPLFLINTAMAGQFNLHLSLSFWTAVILTVPYLLGELWGFVKPALTERELRASRMFVLSVSACFFTGLLFGYFVVAPLSVNFLSGYTVSGDISNMTEIDSYVSLVLNITLACGVVFLLPAAADMMSRAGLLSASFMRRCRRHAIVVMAAMAALITPPDAASMLLVLLPLYGLYEAGIAIAARHNP